MEILLGIALGAAIAGFAPRGIAEGRRLARVARERVLTKLEAVAVRAVDLRGSKDS
jgi:hypothetical protein